MNAHTKQLLTRLWEENPTFDVVLSRLIAESKTLEPSILAVIGRDLVSRRHALYTKIIYLAAYLASDGETGNDRFMDFTDCVAVLPEDRYRRILNNPDSLIDDPVSTNFDELYLIAQLIDPSLLDCEEVDWDDLHSWTEEDARTKLPHLYANFGHILSESKAKPEKMISDVATLDDLLS